MEFSALPPLRLDDNRGSFETEMLTQPVNQEALEREMHLACLVGEDDKGRRPY